MKSLTKRAAGGVLLLVIAGCTAPLKPPRVEVTTTPPRITAQPMSQVTATIERPALTPVEDVESLQETPELLLTVTASEAISEPATATEPIPVLDRDFQGPLLAIASEKLYIFDVGYKTYAELDSLASQPVAWSEDGCSLFFEGRDLALYRTPIGHFEPVEIVDDNWRNPVASPSGDWVAYDEASARVVHVVRGDGSEDVELTDRSGQTAHLLGWTADGQEVLVWAEREGLTSILAIDAQSREARVVADPTFLESYEGESENAPLKMVPRPQLLSPDSQRLLLPLRGELGNIELLGILDFEDGSFRLLYERTIVDFGMDWSPDGKSIVVAARYLSPESTDVSRLYILDVATGQFQLTETPVFNEGGDSSPQWSADGSLLAVRGWLQPYIKNLETGDVTLLREESLEYDAMLWSPRHDYSNNACNS